MYETSTTWLGTYLKIYLPYTTTLCRLHFWPLLNNS